MGKLGPLLTAFDSPHLSESNTGLGNVLFQIASTYGICKTMEMDFYGGHVFEFSEKLKANFGFCHGETIFRNFLLNRGSPIDSVVYESPNHHKLFDIALISKIFQMRHLSLLSQGYMESHLYFYNHQNEIRQLFSMDETSKGYLQSKYPFLFDPERTMIAIHIRTGNSIVEIEEAYYRKAIRTMQERYPTAEYVLFTNDAKNVIVENLMQLVPNVHTVQEREDYLELWAFSQTSHAICCFSTFSWWGSYLIQNPQKTILVPQSSLEYMKKTYHVEEDKIRTEYYTPETQII
jgi:hypothetical protein